MVRVGTYLADPNWLAAAGPHATPLADGDPLQDLKGAVETEWLATLSQAGEEVMVVDPDGPRCPCGQFGCWERYASGSGLGWLARRAVRRGDAPSLAATVADLESLRGEHVTELLGVGNRDACRVFDEYAEWVALGVANLISLLDPDVVALGGGVAAAGDELTGRVRTILSERFPAASEGRSVSIVTTPGGADAGAIGAAILALDVAAPAPEPGSGGSGDGR